MGIKELLRDFAEQKGVIAGVCDGKPLTADGMHAAPFVTGDINARLDPGLSLPGVKSIIVIGAGHNAKCAPERDNTHTVTEIAEPPLRGRISRQAAGYGKTGTDYHIVVARILEELAVVLRSAADFKYKIMVDKNPLSERTLAVKAGLGHIGRNRAVISKSLGSYFSIGIMLTDLELEPDTPVNRRCPEGCAACIEACPGGALTGGAFDYTRCISYLTQKRGALTDAESRLLGIWLYGCDACQEVCPLNAGAAIATDIDCGRLFPLLDSLTGMDKAGFKERYGDSALFWRGCDTIVRNADCARRNLEG